MIEEQVKTAVEELENQEIIPTLDNIIGILEMRFRVSGADINRTGVRKTLEALIQKKKLVAAYHTKQ